MRASRIDPPEYCVNNVPRIREQLAVLPIVIHLLGLNLEQSSFHSRGAAQPPCFKPKDASRRTWIDTGGLPPDCFIAAAMDFAMMSSTQRNRKLVADLAAECR